MVKILVDHRELRSPTARKLFELGAEIDTQSLQVGDYILSDDVVVELKKVEDFVGSLIDGRLFSQAPNLKSFKKPLYIVEGDLCALFERNVHPNAIRAAMISLTLDYGIPFLFSSSPEETAEFLFLIARREQEDRNKEISLRGSKKTMSLSEQQQFFIEGLPSVGPTLAKNLLKHFGSIKAILEAKHDDLQEVDKLGKKKAEIIRNLIDNKYFIE